MQVVKHFGCLVWCGRGLQCSCCCTVYVYLSECRWRCWKGTSPIWWVASCDSLWLNLFENCHIRLYSYLYSYMHNKRTSDLIKFHFCHGIRHSTSSSLIGFDMIIMLFRKLHIILVFVLQKLLLCRLLCGVVCWWHDIIQPSSPGDVLLLCFHSIESRFHLPCWWERMLVRLHVVSQK